MSVFSDSGCHGYLKGNSNFTHQCVLPGVGEVHCI